MTFNNANIEFVGLPGTGKSWLCEEFPTHQYNGHFLSRMPVDKIGSITRNISKIVNGLAFCFTNFTLSRKLYGISKQCELACASTTYKKWFNLLTEMRRAEVSMRSRHPCVVCGRTEKMHLVEQGVVQAIWSLATYAEDEVINHLVSAVGSWLPDIVVLVDTPTKETNYRLLRSRENGQSRFDSLSISELRDSAEAGAALLETILDRWIEAKKGGLFVFYINNPVGVSEANSRYNGFFENHFCTKIYRVRHAYEISELVDILIDVFPGGAKPVSGDCFQQ